MTKISVVLLSVLVGMSCGESAHSQWSAEHVATIPGFHVPECALVASDGKKIYVSNIECEPDAYWADDGKGYIAVLGSDNRVETLRWIDSRTDARLDGPKGMCLLGDRLYFTDNTRLLSCPVAGGKPEVTASGFRKANDLCTEGKNVWLSDFEAGKVFCITPEGEQREIRAPEGVNGITFHGEKFYGVSWTLHEIYELDPSGKKDPVSFGLAMHFTNLDGIEVLDDGTFLVSDFMGNKVCTISPDRSSVTTLVELHSPADIGMNRKAGLLYVPRFMKDDLFVYRIRRSESTE